MNNCDADNIETKNTINFDKNRLPNLEGLIAKIKELDESKDAAGFVLVGINEPKGDMSFKVTGKKLNATTILGALEQYKFISCSMILAAKQKQNKK